MHALIGKGVAETFGKEFISDGAHWLHGLAREEDVYAELSLLEGHTLIVGSTGVGKTRLFDLLIGQAIARGEPVIIIDPKGDHGLASNARKVCEALGQPDRFVYFHPAHPEKSACIDPLRNWNRKTELASRIAALIPSETGADPFTAFGWKVLNDIVNGLIATGQRPNLVQLRRYVEGGPDDLLLKALRRHFRERVNDWESRISGFVKQYKGNQLLAYISFYKQVVIHEAQNVDLDGLISTYEHNREHFQKMVASLIPILSMLTSDPLTELLSPDFEPGHDRVVTDMARIIRADKVMYVGLDSLADSTVGSAIGSILLADLTAVAGDRYNYGINSIKPINVFVDEAAEVINNPTIQLLNKGRGAGFRMVIATQTFADFASRLGDENKARQVLANTNNKITLRVQDAETQKYIADGIPKIKARSMMVRYGHNVDTALHDTYSASYQEQAMEEEADLIPPAILSELPPLHYFARLSGGRTIKGRIPILV
ncbi:conjugative transfer system coupling protein TraD [Tepidimonas sp. HKU77]|uniref:conjugative transfer system coupling protein TraD n=1 Tax=Tepidimonas sp. HKU77 TaxID=3414503 RepID=UPI003C7EBB6B